ncbi:hypothetical protein DB30_07088 [Enhygromyxa salina]|uniref:Uncharacterized protein n=1 Tax=Enhygromyxa salina TaxID=215803 RepID=A0A0C2D1Y4_9BACT|nr:hypothetical protein DB30_07088 [Enhygromyxa salina]
MDARVLERLHGQGWRSRVGFGRGRARPQATESQQGGEDGGSEQRALHDWDTSGVGGEHTRRARTIKGVGRSALERGRSAREGMCGRPERGSGARPPTPGGG